MADLAQTRITAAEFKQLPESSDHIELVDGEIVMSPTPKYKHQRLILPLSHLLDRLTNSGTVVLSPMDVYLDDENVVQPDVFWVSGSDSRCQLGDDDYWHGAPDLVVEVLSPGTALRDKTVKFSLYEKHGVREYWLIDPDAQYIEVWRLENNAFQRIGVFGAADQFESATLGQTVNLAVLFA